MQPRSRLKWSNCPDIACLISNGERRQQELRPESEFSFRKRGSIDNGYAGGRMKLKQFFRQW
jgi:hypothetical protein